MEIYVFSHVTHLLSILNCLGLEPLQKILTKFRSKVFFSFPTILLDNISLGKLFLCPWSCLGILLYSPVSQFSLAIISCIGASMGSNWLFCQLGLGTFFASPSIGQLIPSNSPPTCILVMNNYSNGSVTHLWASTYFKVDSVTL